MKLDAITVLRKAKILLELFRRQKSGFRATIDR